MVPPARLGDRHLAAFVEAAGVEAELHYPGVPTPTVPDAARALGVPPEAIIKSLVFVADERPVLVIAAGEVRVGYRLLADALGVPRKRLRMASPDEALAITGFAVGAMPPFGHRTRLATLVDSASVVRDADVYGGGGTDHALLRVPVETLLRTTEARYLRLSDA